MPFIVSRYRYLVEQYLVKHNLHVQHRVYGCTGFAHIAGFPRVSTESVAAVGVARSTYRQSSWPVGKAVTAR